VEAFLGLSLDVENSFSVDEALANFMAVEELQEDIKVCCLKCKVESNRSKQLSFDKSPQVLVIQLKRFKTASLIFPTKIEKNIAYGMSLDLTSFVSKQHDSVPIMASGYGLLTTVI
jgi:ubiquitin C-terminal hydrolase